MQDALQALESELRDLMEPYARCVWFRYLDDDANAAEDATRACVFLLEDVLWEIWARGEDLLPERLALAREVEAALVGADLGDSPLRAPIHAACLRNQSALETSSMEAVPPSFGVSILNPSG